MLEALLEKLPTSFFSRDGSKLSLIAYAFLFIVCLGFFTPGIVTLPPTDRDESSFAQASKQMVETGNYTDIRLQKEPRYKKPIGIYWLQSASVRVFNPDHLNEIWAYRIPSFAGATVAVLATAALGSVLFSPAAGLLAALMMAGCVLLNVEARLAKTDAALLGSIMIAMVAMARAYKGQATRWATPIAFWTAFAVGVLIKGPIILLPVLGVLLWLKIADRNLGWFKSLRPGLGLLYALILIAPWFIAISMQSHGAFMHQAAGNDMLAKLWQGQNRGFVPPGMHLLALPLLFMPYALFLVLALPDIWKDRRESSVKFLLGWIVPTWIVFELASTKLPHYTLPTYPALAVLTAVYMLQGFPKAMASTWRLPKLLIYGLWLLIGAGYAWLFASVSLIDKGTSNIPQIVAGILLIAAHITVLFLLKNRKVAGFVVLTVASSIFIATTFAYTLPSLDRLWMSRSLVETVQRVKPCNKSDIVSLGYREPSLAFLGGTNTIMAANATDAAEALRENFCRVAAIRDKDIPSFLNAFPPDIVPLEISHVEGLNSGRGKNTAMTLYVLPPEKR